MASKRSSDLSSALGTSEIYVPTSLQRTDDFQSTRTEARNEPLTQQGYEDLDLTRQHLRGFSIAPTRKHNSWIYQYGWRLQDKIGVHYWICRLCHKKRSGQKHIYRSIATTHSSNHLQTIHQVGPSGPLTPTTKKRKRSIAQLYGLPSSTDASIESALAASFNFAQFKSLLLRWIVNNHISFRVAEDQTFKDLLLYLQPQCAGFIPSHQTVSRWIHQVYHNFQGVVTELLATAIGKIHFSFDLWTSSNALALLGLVVHFIDKTGKIWNFLIGLPVQKGAHTGHNIAETAAEIITYYNLQDRIGYFTSDNATNNDKCLEWLAREFNFDPVQARIRCIGHVINLVAKTVMVGNAAESFDEELSTITSESEQLQKWRKRGPVGKLHNLVTYITRSPQRIEQFEALQTSLLHQQGSEGSEGFAAGFDHQTYRLVRDNDTRWNSLFEMIARAIKLRPALEEFCILQTSKWREYETRYEAQNAGKRNPRMKKQPPTILDDVLLSDDWQVLQQYYKILMPLKAATIRLQGHTGHHGALWQVLPTFEKLLNHFESLKQLYFVQNASELSQQYPEAEHLRQDTHFALNINQAWLKLDDYWQRTEETPAYVAATVLHPRYNMAWIQKHWGHNKNWINTAERSLLTLWQQYRDNQFPSPSPLARLVQPPSKRQRTKEEVDFAIFEYSSDEDDGKASSSMDQFTE